MVKLRTPKISGKLRTLTQLRPQLRCATRWTGAFIMVTRFFQIKEHIETIAGETLSIEELMLSPREVREATNLKDQLEALSSVMTKLQDPSLNLANVRTLFDGTLVKFPDFSHIDEGSNIVHSPSFESGVVKLLRGQQHSLTDEEEVALSVLEIDGNEAVPNQNRETFSFADQLLSEELQSKKYLDPSFIPCGSVEAESLFSIASAVWTDRRLFTTPEHIEAYMFLQYNRHLWNESTVAEAIAALDDQ